MPAVATHDDEYELSAAQTEFRDGINSGDPDRAMSVVGEFFTWMRDAEPSYWGREGNRALRQWITRLNKGRTTIAVTPDNYHVHGDFALVRGWETVQESS